MNLIILQSEQVVDEAESFFDSPWWDFTTKMTWGIIVALWLALVYWTYKDSKRRIDDPLMIGIAVATSLIFPYIGTLFYTILRPPEYLDDVEERELEIRARKLEVGTIGERCPACQMPVREDYLVCPNCKQNLKVSCANCSQPMDPAWRVCPFCAVDAGKPASRVEEEELFP